MATLVLVNEGQTDWNQAGLWLSQKDLPLNNEGKSQIKKTAQELKDFKFDFGYTSNLQRAKETLEIILNEINQKDLVVKDDSAFNERNYGLFTGKNKMQVKTEVG